MLSITTKRGKTVADVEKVADYPDKNKNREKQPGAIEDYYSQSSDKTPSKWIGGAAEALGRTGFVDREDHIKTLMGFDPETGMPLVQGAGADRRYGWDLTFSAPKSVSIVWALGSDETNAAVEAAMFRAVEKTLATVEETFSLGRRGQGGVEREKVKLLMSAFLHGSSREQDPQLHIHGMLQNLAQRMDGSWGAIEPKEIFEWKMAEGAIFRAELSSEMRNLGFGIEADGDSFRISGIPKALEEEFSRRREQIEALLNEKGWSGGKASEVAALDSRKGKEVLDNETLREDWERRGREYGIDGNVLESLRSHESNHVSQSLDRKALLASLTQTESVFGEKDLWRKVAVELSHRGLGNEAVKKEIEDFRTDPELVRLRGKDGKTWYTTREILEIEERIVMTAESGKEARNHIVSRETLNSAVARFEFKAGFLLSEEQKNAVHHITSDPGQVTLVRGWAGAGKTTALEAAKLAWESGGLEVLGGAPSGKVAAGLQKETGIRSQTIHSLLNELEGYDREDGTRADPSRQLTAKSVIVVDEAGMVDSRLMNRIMIRIGESGAKLVLVGDDSQLAPVQAGAPFRTLVERLGAAELTENRRQRDDSQKEASRALREGRTREALETYLDKGALTVAETRDEGIREIIDKWSRMVRADNMKEMVIGATTRSEVADLNRLAREHLKATGHLQGSGTAVSTTDRSGNFAGKREFMEGDRILFKSNDRKLGVKNGQVGTLERIGNDRDGKREFSVKMDDDRTLTFSPESYSALKHGYAMTAHELQGTTVEKSFVLVSHRFTDRELNYVLGTRHREGMELVLTAPMLEEEAGRAGIDLAAEKPLDRVKELTEKMGESRGKESSLDYEVEKETVPEKEWDEEIRMEREKVRPERSKEREHMLEMGF
jgi:Ti-type conjugative transfer relaxase TraA